MENQNKYCKRCLLTKEVNNFSINKYSNDGYYSICKDCKKIYLDKYRLNNKEKTKVYHQNNYKLNKDKISIRINEYQKNNKEKLKLAEKKYISSNINVKLSKKLRTRLNMALISNQKAGSAVKDLGCSIEQFKVYLESKFQPGMTWENYGFYGWHMDHIKPLSLFDLTKREELLKACHYTNLQPLWASDNFKKGNRV